MFGTRQVVLFTLAALVLGLSLALSPSSADATELDASWRQAPAYATSAEKCAAPGDGMTPGIGLVNGRFVGYEWSCRISGGESHELDGGVVWILDCNEEGHVSRSVAFARSLSDGAVLSIEFSGFGDGAFAFYRCP